MKTIYVIFIFFALACIVGCKGTEMKGLVENSSTPPSIVTNVHVKNEHGAAVISYTVPSDKDLLYIKAVYTLSSGEEREVKSSYYNNSLRVDGFNDTLKHNIALYAVNRSEVLSKAVLVEINPLESPLQIAFKNLNVEAVAGGVRVKSINPYRGDLAIVPLIDSLNNGEWENMDNIYTSDSAIASSIRGLPPIERKFAFYIRDRWNNQSDTLFETLIPKKEVELDKSKFFAFYCDNDSKFSYNTSIELMWNGNPDPNQWPCVNTDISSSEPAVLTWGLGDKPVKLTRFNLLTRSQSGLYFIDGSPKLFEIYGSNDPSHTGDWSEWTKILTCHVTKPSGLPLGQETNADAVKGAAGFTFDFDEDTPPYRYLRLKCLENWNSSYFIVIEQITFWGTE